MRKSFVVGREEKHRISFTVNWFFGYVHLSVDGRTVFRRPFFLKIDRTFEVGDREKHMVRIQFNLFDYFRNIFKVVVDGMDVTRSLDIQDASHKIDTPVDDAAAAVLFIALINIVFAVIGTLFTPYLDSLEVRLLLLGGALIYLLFAVKILSGSVFALFAAAVFFLADSAVNLFYTFSAGGLVVRGLIFFYLAAGIRFWLDRRRHEIRART